MYFSVAQLGFSQHISVSFCIPECWWKLPSNFTGKCRCILLNVYNHFHLINASHCQWYISLTVTHWFLGPHNFSHLQQVTNPKLEHENWKSRHKNDEHLSLLMSELICWELFPIMYYQKINLSWQVAEAHSIGVLIDLAEDSVNVNFNSLVSMKPFHGIISILQHDTLLRILSKCPLWKQILIS